MDLSAVQKERAMLFTIEEIEAALREKLPNLSVDDCHDAAKAIITSDGKWRELDVSELGSEFSVQCRDICAVGEAVEQGLRIRAFVCRE
jgi:hypothetical protein